MSTGIVRAVAALCLTASVALFTGCAGSPSNPAPSNPPATGATPVVSPSVTSITPAKISAGAATTTLTVTGANFNAGSSVQVGGVVEATTFGSGTQLTAMVPASQLASGSLLPIVV